MKKSNDPYVVSKATCGGCRYYKAMSGIGTMMYCSYTLETGDIKPHDMKCADCTYKDTGRKQRIPTKGIF